MVNLKKLTGVADVKDLSDRKTGLRLVIDCKTGFNPHAVLDELYRLTPLQENFSINNVALVDGAPQTLGLRDLCQLFLAHRLSVVKRRCEFRLRKAQARVHILEGLIKALAAIDEVVAVIKKSKDTAEARLRLQKVFVLGVIQSDAILEMALRRLTSLEVTKLKDEMRELNKDIAYLSKLIASEKALKVLVGEELDKTSTAFSTARRTKLLNAIPASATVAANLEVLDEPCVVVLSSSGLLGRFEASSFTGRPSKHDVLVSQVITTNRAQIGLVTAQGSLLRMSVLEIPVANASSRGLKVSDVFGIASGDSAVGLVDARPGATVSMVTLQGLVKRVETSEFPTRIDARPIIGLKPDDRVVFAVSLPSPLADVADMFLVTSDAQLLRFPAKMVATKGLPAGGMAGIRLAAKAFVASAGLVDAASSAVVVTVSDSGALKVSLASEYPAKGRGTGGVRCQTFRKNESHLTAAAVGFPVPVALSSSGTPVTFKDDRTRRDGPGVAQSTGIAGFGFLRSID